MAQQNNWPKLHNAMWPGVVGKGPDSEPFISLDAMLDMTAAAEVDGVKFDGVDLFLADPHTSIDSSDDDIKKLADKVAAKHLVIGSMVAPVWPPVGGGSAMGSAEERQRFVAMVEKSCRIGEDLMSAVDKADSAQFARAEILRPEGWTLLNFLMDSRTGLGRFRQFRISNYELMMQLIDYCRNHTIEQILSLPDVKERVDLYSQHAAQFRAQILRCARVHRDLVVLDLRDEETIYAGNRFAVYALFPQCRVSMHVLWGVKQQNTVFAIGKSIIDRSSPIDVGALCLRYGGGGHAAAGTCQVDNAKAAEAMAALIQKLAASAH